MCLFISKHFELENGVKITPKRRFFLPALFFTCFCSKNVNKNPFEILRRQIFLPFHTRQLIKCLPAFTKMNLLGGASPYRPLKEVPPRPFVRDLTKFHTLHAWLIFTMQTTSKLTLNLDVLLYLDYILATPRLLRGVAEINKWNYKSVIIKRKGVTSGLISVATKKDNELIIIQRSGRKQQILS